MNLPSDFALQRGIDASKRSSLNVEDVRHTAPVLESPTLSSVLSTPYSGRGSPYQRLETSQGYFDLPPTTYESASHPHAVKGVKSDFVLSAFAALADTTQFSPRIDPLEDTAHHEHALESPLQPSRPNLPRHPSASLSQVMSASARLSSPHVGERSSSRRNSQEHDRHLTMSSFSSERSSDRDPHLLLGQASSSKSSATYGSSRGSRTSYAPSVASSSSSRSWRSSSTTEEEETNYLNMLQRRERVLNHMGPEERRKMERDAQRGDQLAAYRLGLAPAKTMNRGWHNIGSIASVWGPAMSAEPSVIRRATDVDRLPSAETVPTSRSIFQPLDSSTATQANEAGDLFHAMATMTLNDNARSNNRTKNPLTAARVPLSSPAISKDHPIQFRPELAPRRNPEDKSIHFNGDYFGIRAGRSSKGDIADPPYPATP